MQTVEAKAEVSPSVTVEEPNEKEICVDDDRFGQPLLQVCHHRLNLLPHFAAADITSMYSVAFYQPPVVHQL